MQRKSVIYFRQGAHHEKTKLTLSTSRFTLVEIAIVLVIIGLLLGGVLKGQELVNSAKSQEHGQRFCAIFRCLSMAIRINTSACLVMIMGQQPVLVLRLLGW